MKILSVGNSFSQDAQRWLNDIAIAGGDDIDTYNLFIGGCSLETHLDCIKNKKSDYSLEGNGGVFIRNTTANEIIEGEQFDVITVQQASAVSGMPQSYIPYLTELVNYIKKYQPGAKLYFHKTWSYEIDSTHGGFVFYNKDRGEMFRRISDCAETVEKLTGIEIIPVGDFIQYLRENTDEFNYSCGGISLCRDGFHLLETYGRFAAGAVWYKTLTDKFVNIEKFAAKNSDFDIVLLNVIIEKLRDFYK